MSKVVVPGLRWSRGCVSKVVPGLRWLRGLVDEGVCAEGRCSWVEMDERFGGRGDVCRRSLFLGRDGRGVVCRGSLFLG